MPQWEQADRPQWVVSGRCIGRPETPIKTDVYEGFWVDNAAPSEGVLSSWISGRAAVYGRRPPFPSLFWRDRVVDRRERHILALACRRLHKNAQGC